MFCFTPDQWPSITDLSLAELHSHFGFPLVSGLRISLKSSPDSLKGWYVGRNWFLVKSVGGGEATRKPNFSGTIQPQNWSTFPPSRMRWKQQMSPGHVTLCLDSIGKRVVAPRVVAINIDNFEIFILYRMRKFARSRRDYYIACLWALGYG